MILPMFNRQFMLEKFLYPEVSRLLACPQMKNEVM
jgi:hypothetical protein